jgi:hypothetical protein
VGGQTLISTETCGQSIGQTLISTETCGQSIGVLHASLVHTRATHTARLTFLSCQRPYTRARPPLSRASPSRPRSCVARCNERCFRGGHAVVGTRVLHTTPYACPFRFGYPARPLNCVILELFVHFCVSTFVCFVTGRHCRLGRVLDELVKGEVGAAAQSTQFSLTVDLV